MDNDFYASTITSSEIKNLIKKLKNNKAPVFDKISNIIIKNLSKKPYIINTIFKFQYFSTYSKNVTIIPVPKPNKDHSSSTGYHRISVLDCLSKLTERFILN